MSRMPLIEIAGAPRERGRQYGEQAREQIERSIAWYRDQFAETAKLSWDEILASAPRWEPLIDAYLPDATEEIRGVAEGSGTRYEEILALNGRGELSAGNPFLEEANTLTRDAPAKPAHPSLSSSVEPTPDGCSSYSILPEAAGDGHAYCGQNWDWRSAILDTVVMLRIEQPGKPTVVMQTEAGQIGRQGANSAGIGLNANGLGARFGARIGMPQPYVRRRILDSWDMNEALEAVFESQQSLCTNLLLSHRDGFAIDLETTPGRHGWGYPVDGILVHTNHFRYFVPKQIEGTYRYFSPDSLYRAERIERVLARAPEATTGEAMRALVREALSDHFGFPDSVCNHPNESDAWWERGRTVASSIVDLTSGEYWITHGNPCEREYELLPWNLYDTALEPAAAERAALA
jgi:isopenicillin-N N-acyltransferase like protein